MLREKNVNRTLVAFAASMLLWATPAQSADLIAEYLTFLGPNDTRNSSGKRLTKFGDILAQDRANYHRFGVRDDYDSSDPIFGSRDMRAKLPALYQAGRRVEKNILNDVLSGRGHYVYIRVMGTNGRVTHVDVYEGAG